jgi:hypothetical protein
MGARLGAQHWNPPGSPPLLQDSSLQAGRGHDGLQESIFTVSNWAIITCHYVDTANYQFSCVSLKKKALGLNLELSPGEGGFTKPKHRFKEYFDTYVKKLRMLLLFS